MPVILLPQILTIVELSLRLALKIAEDMPVELRQKHWERHQQFMEFWWALARKVEASIVDKDDK